MTTAAEIEHLKQHGLYSTANEHDACGLGFVAHIKGEKRHDIVTQALKILGAMGFMRGTRSERIYREVKVMMIGGGTEEIMKELAARQLGV